MKTQSHPSWQWYPSNIWTKRILFWKVFTMSQTSSSSWVFLILGYNLKQPPTSSFLGWTLPNMTITLFGEVNKHKVSESGPASSLPTLSIRSYIEAVAVSLPSNSLNSDMLFSWELFGIWASYTLGRKSNEQSQINQEYKEDTPLGLEIMWRNRHSHSQLLVG